MKGLVCSKENLRKVLIMKSMKKKAKLISHLFT